MDDNKIKNMSGKFSQKLCEADGSDFKKSNYDCFHSLAKPASFFILLSLPAASFGAESFNPEMLKATGGVSDLQDVDLNYFAEKGGQMPGSYKVNVYLNNQQVDLRTVNFVSLKEYPGKLYGQLTPEELVGYGVILDTFPDLKAAPQTEIMTKPLNVYVKDATETLDLNRMRYDITVPQVGVDTRPRNAIDPKRWEAGIPAIILNYSYSGSTTSRDDSDSQSHFVNLRSGANVGPWRLRNYSTYSEIHNSSDNGHGNSSDSNQREFQSINTYVQRDVPFLQGGQLTLGQTATPGDVFDSIQFTGAQLASDDQMLPDSMSQFAPTVRGIAKSNAQVTVKQNGYTIYQTNVSPGAFAITDLYPSSNGGDLEVTVKEADNSETKFTVATSSVPILQREKRLKYNLVMGEYRTGTDDTKTPQFIQISNIYGLTSRTTIYGGVQYADNYRAVTVGLGRDLGAWGAISFDGTQATSQFDDNSLGTKKGQSYRAMYAKNFERTDTNLEIAGYRYSTKGYYSFSDVQDYQADPDSDNDFDNYNRSHNQRSKIQLTISQSFGDYGSINISGSRQNYWGGDGVEKLIQLGYSTTIYGVSLGLNYNYSKNPGTAEADKIVAFNMSVPFDLLLGHTGAWMTYNMSSNKNGTTSQQAGISGNLLQDNNLSYAVQQGYENEGQGSSGNASLDYKGNLGESNLGYNYDDHTQQWTYGVQGGVVIHQNGVTLSQPLSDTIALVKAPDAGGVNVKNNTGVKTDWRGYAVVPYVQPYRKNSIELDTQSFGDDVDMDFSSQTVIPTRGAVTIADFKTRVGQRALIQLLFSGKPVPFGATVTLMQDETDDDKIITGIVSDQGQVYLSGLPEEGNLMVKWGDDSNQKCKANYALRSDKKSADSAELIKQITAQCH